jgi:MFS family permease
MRGRRPGFGEVLGVGEFRALWGAELCSILGDQFARVALALLVFQQTSSAGLTALTYALTFAPAVLGGALLSGLADRYPRRRVLVVTDLLRAALAGAMAVPGLPLPALWTLVGVLCMAGAPFKAAQLALLPQILTGERYVVGLSLRQITGQTAQLAGFASGGLIIAAVEPHLAIALNAGTFLASALLIMQGVRPRPAAMITTDPRATAGPAVRLASSRNLLPLVVLVSIAGLFVVPEGVAAPYGAAIGVGSIGVGLLMAADPLGSVLGAWLIARVRLRPTRSSMLLLAAGSGVPLVICGLGPGLLISIMLWAFSGVLSTAYLIQTQATVVELVPDHRRGQVMGRIATCLYASQGIAIVVGGVAAEVTGPFRAVAGAGLLGLVLVLCVGGWWQPVARSRRDLVVGSEHGSTGDRSLHHSLFGMQDTSSLTGRQYDVSTEDGPLHHSLFRMQDTSFPTGHEHDVSTEDGPLHHSLFRIQDTSSRAGHRRDDVSNENESPHHSLLRMPDTSSEADDGYDDVTQLAAERIPPRNRRWGPGAPSLWGWLHGMAGGRVCRVRMAR